MARPVLIARSLTRSTRSSSIASTRQRHLVLGAVLVARLAARPRRPRPGSGPGGRRSARRPSRSPRPRAAATPTMPADLVRAQQPGQRPASRRRSRRAGSSPSSCSSRTSPTISSTRSSSVTSPVDVAELVDDERHLQPAGAQRVEQVVELEALRDQHRRVHDLADRRPRRARSNGTLTACLMCTMPVNAPFVAEHGKARAPALARDVDDRRRPGRPRSTVAHAPARGHDLVRAALAERQRALQQRGGAALERALLGRAAHERGQLLGRAGRGQLLLRLDADPPQDRVRGAVEERG